jgi:membrane fusion protein, multidrug efflux system
MDQRTDSEIRREAPQRSETIAAAGERKNDRSWLQRLRRRRRMVLVITALLIVAMVGTVAWWVAASGYVSTDDAFIDARTVSISSQLNAYIDDVPVTDNQPVEAGALLVRLDSRDYKVQVDQARAQVDQAEANIGNMDAQISAQQARIQQAEKQTAQAQAALDFAREQNERYERLVKNGAATVEQAHQYASNYLQAQANFAAAERNAMATQRQLTVLRAQRKQAEAQVEMARATLEQAEINLARTEIVAPVAGRVAQLTAAKGKFASAGQALMTFVPREVWVTANFKETDLKNIRPGAPVSIRIAAYPNRKFDGHVDSIQAGSGTAFSLLPAENATGNFVWIVQRVPVKIVFDKPPDVLLGPGMSVVPTVKIVPPAP